VLPECVGNDLQQVLPPGVVCKKCNGYFGTKIEPVLLGDPLFHVIAVFLRLVDPDDMNAFRDRLFDVTHTPVAPPQRTLNLAVGIRGRELSVDVTYKIQGCLTREYSHKQLKLLSRAIHKIAFESLAWSLFVKGLDEPVDLFSASFKPVRAWAREGKPQNSVRPVLRRPGNTISTQWETRLWKLGHAIGAELCLFGDWYGLTLTSVHSEALTDLCAWVGQDAENLWCIADTLLGLASP
jgi:hypothetical protein